MAYKLLTDYLDEAVARTSDKMAVVDRFGRLTYREFRTRVLAAHERLQNCFISAGRGMTEVGLVTLNTRDGPRPRFPVRFAIDV